MRSIARSLVARLYARPAKLATVREKGRYNEHRDPLPGENERRAREEGKVDSDKADAIIAIFFLTLAVLPAENYRERREYRRRPPPIARNSRGGPARLRLRIARAIPIPFRAIARVRNAAAISDD